MTYNTYLATSKEFQPLRIFKTVAGVTTQVLAGVQYVAVQKGTPLQNGTLLTPSTLEGEIGFFTDTLTVGYWDIAVRIADNPEQPFIYCGTVRIK